MERHEFAKLLRKHSTKAEDILWESLRGSRFHGAKFGGKFPSIDMSPTSIVAPPGSSLNWTAGNMPGSRTMTRNERGSCRPVGFVSFALSTLKSKAISTAFWRGFVQRSADAANEQRHHLVLVLRHMMNLYARRDGPRTMSAGLKRNIPCSATCAVTGSPREPLLKEVGAAPKPRSDRLC